MTIDRDPAPFCGDGPHVEALSRDLPSAQAKIRERLLDLIGRPPFDPPPTRVDVIERHDDGDLWREKLTYGSPVDDVVFAWLLHQKNLRTPAPAVICLPGSFMTPNWGKDAPAGLAGPLVPGDPEAYGRDLARAGFVTLCPDYPCCGERTPAGLKSHDTRLLDARFPAWTRVGLSAWDVSRAVDVLESRDEVAAGRIGVCGWSQGGQMALIGATLDERLGAVVSVCGWGPWRGVGGRRARNWAVSYNFPRLTPALGGVRPLPIDFDHIVAGVAPRPLLDVRAEADDVFTNRAQIDAALERCAQVWVGAGAGDRFRVRWCEGGHAHGACAATAQTDWLRRWLM